MSFMLEEPFDEWRYYIAEEMDRYRIDAIKRFHIMVQPNYAEEIAVTIAFGFAEELPEALKIVDQLFLNEKHIAALREDENEMEKILLDEKYEDSCMNEYYDREENGSRY